MGLLFNIIVVQFFASVVNKSGLNIQALRHKALLYFVYLLFKSLLGYQVIPQMSLMGCLEPKCY